MSDNISSTLLQGGSIAQIRTFMRQGIMEPQHRRAMWCMAWGLPQDISSSPPVSDGMEYITDDLFRLDVQATTNDSDFFPFEELLVEVSLRFAHDPWIPTHTTYAIHTYVHQSELTIPPSGVQPFAGLALYMAPLCFIAENTEVLYTLFNHMWTKMWCKLNVLHSHKDTFITLCTSFERLVIRAVPGFIADCIQVHGIHPLEIGMEWIHRAFVGILPVQQVLLLWDQIICREDLHILPVAAAALFVYRVPQIQTWLLENNMSLSEMQIRLREHNDQIDIKTLVAYFLFESNDLEHIE